MYANHEDRYHKEIKEFLESAFNDDSVCGGAYKLSVNFWVGNVWSDVYDYKMMNGQFDIAFGAISGNALDPIGFLEVLSSDQSISHNFTLNWGADTNDPDVYPLVYDPFVSRVLIKKNDFIFHFKCSRHFQHRTTEFKRRMRNFHRDERISKRTENR